MEAARRARPEDLAAVADLHREALEGGLRWRGGDLLAAREARPLGVDDLAAALDDDRRAVWVGTIDDVILGYAVAHVEDLRDGRRLGVIDDVYVVEGAREVGVGEALIDEVVAWCTAEGCSGIDVLALPGDRLTKNVFESAGFVARLIVAHRRLDGGGGATP